MRTMSLSTSGSIGGRPGLRFFEPSYLLATSRRYQAMIVSGVTIAAMSFSACIPMRLQSFARRTRSWSVTGTRPGNFERRISFSAARYSFRSRSSSFT
jgi:hypothetical protein